MDSDLIFKIGLGLIPNVGSVTGKKLISYCGSAEEVFHAKFNFLTKIPDIGEIIARSIVNQKILSRAEEEIRFIEKNNITPLFYLDKGYPYRLKQCEDGPMMIFYKGNADLSNKKIISIVGTRSATDYGKRICRDIITGLIKQDIIIVSGLAYGIDICAHKIALELGIPTIGVVAHGLDMIYPSLHKPVADKMIEKGGIITEFLSNTNPDRENFPARNRIIAGLSDATLVIESKAKGGALITADIANSYDRDVFAVPGRADDTFSSGCNTLIKSNKAALVESAADIEYLMQWNIDTTKAKKAMQTELFLELTENEKKILRIIKEVENIDIDNICIKSGLVQGKVISILLNLELYGLILSLPGKVYKIN
ncbi:MAG: DNA-processing protein DprA [Bacteroidota bacterium]|nr:DNA-processing protein DprA [Bacteroidota bacterium]